MKTSWTTYSVETPFSSVEAHVNGSIKRSHPHSDIVRVNDLSSPISLAAPIEGTLTDVAKIITETVDCDSCTVYVAEGKNLVLRAWSNPHPEIEERVLAKLVFDVTRCAAAGPESLVAERAAHADSRVRMFFREPLEDRFESFLSVPIVGGERLLGAINVQKHEPGPHSDRENGLIEMFGFLVGAEMERARLASENLALVDRLESRKIVERAKGILQRDLRLNEEDAYLMLQRESRQRRKTMKEVAQAILLSDDLKKRK